MVPLDVFTSALGASEVRGLSTPAMVAIVLTILFRPILGYAFLLFRSGYERRRLH